MIKTIKVKKKLRLDELIKYVWDNDIKAEQELVEYKSNTRTIVTVDMSGQIAVYGAHFGNEVFTVEVEEDITEETRFSYAIALSQWGEKITDLNACNYGNLTLGKILGSNIERDLYQIYALIENKLELVWEAE